MSDSRDAELVAAERTLAELSADSAEALELLSRLAGAVFAPEQRDTKHLCWSDRGPVSSRIQNPELAAEERLRAAEARFRNLVEQIPAVTFMAALGEGENEVYVSPHIESLLGFSQHEWLADPFLWYRQLHPDDRILWNEEFTRGCARGGPFQAECRFLAKDGRVVWVHGEARIIKDELGRPEYLQGIAFDITESKQAQQILLERAVQQAKYAEELEIARHVQLSILPKRLDVPGLEISALMLPAAEVGGDYYDVFPEPDGAWLAIGDVSGHGLRAGVVMLMMQSALSALVIGSPARSPAAVVARLNRILHHNVRTRLAQDEHVTFTLLRYRSDGSVRFAGAHEILLLYRARTGSVQEVFTSGTWLGVTRDISEMLSVSALHLRPGDVLLLYTDGVTEAMNGQREQYGLSRLAKVLREAASEPAEVILRRILDDVQRFMLKQEDDISLVVLKQLGIVGPSP